MSGIDGRARRVSIGGALLAALAASSCCLGPLLLAALGIGGAGVAGVLGAYRPYLLAATAGFLAAGFYFSYRKPKVGTADACGCERPRASRAGRMFLWVATIVVVLVAAAPPVLARWADARRSPTSTGSDVSLATAVIAVPGMDCEACAAPMRATLARVGGFRDLKLDIPKQAVTVTYQPASDRPAAYVAAIRGLGYEATLANEVEVRR
jgi:mercuric ion transport protein